MVHDLKLLSQYFSAVADGSKTFEVREHGRPYCVGDVLTLREIVLDNGITRYTGRHLQVNITFILDDDKYCKTGYCILGIKLRGCGFAF